MTQFPLFYAAANHTVTPQQQSRIQGNWLWSVVSSTALERECGQEAVLVYPYLLLVTERCVRKKVALRKPSDSAGALGGLGRSALAVRLAGAYSIQPLV